VASRRRYRGVAVERDPSAGDGTGNDSTLPVTVLLNGVQLATLATGSIPNHMCGMTSAQELYCWGSNGYGQLGDGTKYDAFVPIRTTLQ